MMKSFVSYCIFFLCSFRLIAQSDPGGVGNSDLPIVITLHFQNLALPFKDLKSNFGNVGISVGTEFYYTGSKTWLQQVHLGYYFNKNTGNAWMLYTQAVYRPWLNDELYAEVKSGLGWQLISHPVENFRFKNGEWTQSKEKKLQWIVPIGVSAGYQSGKDFSTFLSYQLFTGLFYNKVVPVNFYSFIQTGVTLNPQK